MLDFAHVRPLHSTDAVLLASVERGHLKTPTTNTIALLTLIGAIGLMVYLFAGSRNDPSLRIAALVAGTGLVSALAAIASTILTGKDLTKPQDLPPGSSSSTSQVIKVPEDPAKPSPLPAVLDPNLTKK